MCIKRQGGLVLSKACGFLQSACRELELQPTDFMDPIFRILTTSDSRPSITLNSPLLHHASLAAVSHFSLPLSRRLTHSPRLFFVLFFFASVLPSSCIPDCAVPCWASGSSLVLQRRSLIQCFKKLSGRM